MKFNNILYYVAVVIVCVYFQALYCLIVCVL